MTTDNHCSGILIFSFRISHTRGNSFSPIFDFVPHIVCQHSVNQRNLFDHSGFSIIKSTFRLLKALYLIQCSLLEHFYNFFKSEILEKLYITKGYLVIPIISLTPTKNTCCIFPQSLLKISLEYTFSFTSSKQASYLLAITASLIALNFSKSFTTLLPKNFSPSFRVGS